LVEFFRIDERPTGSGDPYALRRAALGALRILLEDKVRLDITKVLPLSSELLEFFVDRLEVVLRNRGVRHDVLDAVFSIQKDADFVRLVALVEAAQTFLKSDDGANLLTAYKRAANILKAEEKKDGKAYEGAPDPEAFVVPEEKALFVDLATASEAIRGEIARERFVEAMSVMARLRKPVDAFFDKVTVNAPEKNLRANRLLLLSRLRATLHLVADFSKIEG
jgi:glycyl-tRNA synthetase beta chain